MKKKDLLALPPVPNPFSIKKQRPLFQTEYCITSRVLKKNILEIDGYYRHTGEIAFRHFADKKRLLDVLSGNT